MPRRHLALILLLCLMVLGCSPEHDNSEPRVLAPAQALIEGESKARVCMSCHGPGGISRVATYPSLAGKSQDYLLEQLVAFKDGTRENPMMNAMVASLTQENMEVLALYFSSQAAPAKND